MNIFNRMFSRYKLEKVFTPNTVAKLTYVERGLLENDLEKYISLPGKQIIVYGHSGGGKTTLIRNQLKKLKINFIKTHCESNTSFNDIILQAFDGLNMFYINEKTSRKVHSVSSNLKAEFGSISSKINSSISESEGSKSIRIVPPQLTAQKLAQFMGEVNSIWIIEDFHKVREEEKKRIADVVKVFIDSANDYNNVKIICIGAVGTARELIEFDDNLSTRVVELFVPLLKDDEIRRIVEKGCELLNLKMDKNLIEKIIYYSNNLASITHQICYDICFHEEIRKSLYLTRRLYSDAFKYAVESFVRKNSDTFTKIYDSIDSVPVGKHILRSFDDTEKEYISLLEFKNRIPMGKRFSVDEIQDFLTRLGSSEYKELVRFDRITKKYSMSNPFFRAFLKMKLALVKSELKERKDKKKKKRGNVYSIEPETFILNEEFFKDYYKYLDSFIAKQVNLEKNVNRNK